MTAGDLAAVIVSIVMIAAIVVIAVVAGSILRSLRELRATLAELRGEALPLMGELRETVSAAGAEVGRVDDLLDSAEAISARVDSASRLGYLAFRAPIIRVVAIGRGVGRGTRRLVSGPAGGSTKASATTPTRVRGRDRSRSGPRAA